ncbi:SpaA isopeptide-forming pilin-related protein [Levilactobacillus tongjiangensis]|uniref:SpaA isopeptide-forming pilin-related protein n=1 Tax=Levilactobacillus tongjiangensis TaxID=2486023 RepID=A0ABW1SRL2_9LACO|nr:SpaA isopeptide-forming pilin-related protein [Levilactobacillus tongjiangensis]
MRRKITTAVIGVLIAITIVILGGLSAGGITAHAGSVTVSGLDGSNATITDSNGTPIPNGSDLSKWNNYTIDYNWSIPDGEVIKDGDTATVTFPHSAVGRRDVTFPLYDDNGQKIGTFSIKEGESTGTITFNDALSNTTKDRKGNLQFYVKGSTTEDNTNLDWGINKVGWVAERNPDGSPAKLTWNIAFNPTSSSMGQAVVTDSLGPGQEYVPGSVHAQTGSYDSNGFFTSDGGSITPAINVMGSVLTFTFSDVKTAVNMTYQTTPSVSGTGGTWKNNASLNGKNVSARIVWGGSGTGNGNGDDQQTGEVILKKTAKTNGEVLAGAVYDLQDTNGKVIKANLVTDTEGLIKCDGLAAGNYQFVEVTPPAGFELSKEPIPFTITDGQTAAVMVTATDVRENSSSEGGGTPENPGGGGGNTETPTNPGTETPTNPETPQEPQKPQKPEKPTKPNKPVKPTKPTGPTTHKPGTSSPSNQQTVAGGSGAYTTTTGHNQPSGGFVGANSGSGVGSTPHSGTAAGTYVGQTLPQTGERSTQGYTWLGILLLAITGLGATDWKLEHKN